MDKQDSYEALKAIQAISDARDAVSDALAYADRADGTLDIHGPTTHPGVSTLIMDSFQVTCKLVDAVDALVRAVSRAYEPRERPPREVSRTTEATEAALAAIKKTYYAACDAWTRAESAPVTEQRTAHKE